MEVYGAHFLPRVRGCDLDLGFGAAPFGGVAAFDFVGGGFAVCFVEVCFSLGEAFAGELEDAGLGGGEGHGSGGGGVDGVGTFGES